MKGISGDVCLLKLGYDLLRRVAGLNVSNERIKWLYNDCVQSQVE